MFGYNIREEYFMEIEKVYAPSDKIVAREIEGELIIIPLAAGIGDMEDELFTLNDTGKAIWKRLDGKNSLKMITDELASEFEAPREEIEKDVLGLTQELVKRQMLSEVN
jgi:coenzyme PQQ biosynthesis protein PqqD